MNPTKPFAILAANEFGMSIQAEYDNRATAQTWLDYHKSQHKSVKYILVEFHKSK